MKIIFLVIASFGVISCGGGEDSGSSNVTCSSFRYQEDAQANYSKKLDSDSDGIACESLPKRPSSSTNTNTNQQNNSSTNTSQQPSLSFDDASKVAAAFLMIRANFDKASANQEFLINKTVGENNTEKYIQCGTSLSSGYFKIAKSAAPKNKKDYLVTYRQCYIDDYYYNLSSYRFCDDDDCINKKIGFNSFKTGKNPLYYLIEMDGSIEYKKSEKLKGRIKIKKNGIFSHFRTDEYYMNGLSKTTINNKQYGGGSMLIENSENVNCLNGEYIHTYNDMVLDNNSQRPISGTVSVRIKSKTDSALIHFNEDKTIKVVLSDGKEKNISMDEFESYCGLKEAYEYPIIK